MISHPVVRFAIPFPPVTNHDNLHLASSTPRYDGVIFRTTLAGKPIPMAPPPDAEWSVMGKSAIDVLRLGLAKWSEFEAHKRPVMTSTLRPFTPIEADGDTVMTSRIPSIDYNVFAVVPAVFEEKFGGRPDPYRAAAIIKRIEEVFKILADDAIMFSKFVRYYQLEHKGLGWVTVVATNERSHVAASLRSSYKKVKATIGLLRVLAEKCPAHDHVLLGGSQAINIITEATDYAEYYVLAYEPAMKALLEQVAIQGYSVVDDESMQVTATPSPSVQAGY